MEPEAPIREVEARKNDAAGAFADRRGVGKMDYPAQRRATFLNILAGTPHFKTEGVDEAIAARFILIRDGEDFAKRDARDPRSFGFCYDGNRCEPGSLGWRFVQMHGEVNPDAIEVGAFDAEIAETYHEAASAEHWYRYEKDWGTFE